MELLVECHVGLSRGGSWRRLTLMFPRSPDVERTHRHLRLVLRRGQNGEESVGGQRMAERGREGLALVEIVLLLLVVVVLLLLFLSGPYCLDNEKAGV